MPQNSDSFFRAPSCCLFGKTPPVIGQGTACVRLYDEREQYCGILNSTLVFVIGCTIIEYHTLICQHFRAAPILGQGPRIVGEHGSCTVLSRRLPGYAGIHVSSVFLDAGSQNSKTSGYSRIRTCISARIVCGRRGGSGCRSATLRVITLEKLDIYIIILIRFCKYSSKI